MQALRLKRAQEREKLETERMAKKAEKTAKTPAGEQLGLVDKLVMSLNRIHKRI